MIDPSQLASGFSYDELDPAISQMAMASTQRINSRRVHRQLVPVTNGTKCRLSPAPIAANPFI